MTKKETTHHKICCDFLFYSIVFLKHKWNETKLLSAKTNWIYYQTSINISENELWKCGNFKKVSEMPGINSQFLAGQSLEKFRQLFQKTEKKNNQLLNFPTKKLFYSISLKYFMKDLSCSENISYFSVFSQELLVKVFKDIPLQLLSFMSSF